MLLASLSPTENAFPYPGMKARGCLCVLRSQADGGFVESWAAFGLHNRRAPALAAVDSKEVTHGRPVLIRHDVVEDGVDGSAQVKEHEGHETAVLADQGHDGGARGRGGGDQEADDVEGKPAEHKGQHHHSYGGRRTGAVRNSISLG